MQNLSTGADPLDATFAALADGTRRAILRRLAAGEATVNQIAEPFKVSQPTISKHLKVLERAGLIARGHDAQRRPRRLLLRPLEQATDWLRAYRNPGTLHLSTPRESEIVLKRLFAVPRQQIFNAFTQPALLKQWLFGVPDASLLMCRVALKKGETFRYVWRNPDGTEMGMSGVCLEFKRPDRLVATEEWDKPWYPGKAASTIDLVEEGGVTELTQTLKYESSQAREIVLSTHIEHAVAMGYDRLAALLASVKHGRKSR